MIQKNESKMIGRAIKKANPIIIAKHQSPDWDADGSAFGLAYLLQENYPNKTIYVVGDRLDKNKEFWPPNPLPTSWPQTTLLITVDTANLERLDFSEFDKIPKSIKIDHHPDLEPYATFNLVDDQAIACTQMIIQLAESLHWKWNSQAANYLYKGLLTDSGRFLHDKTNSETFQAAAVVNKQGVNMAKIHEELYVDTLKNRQWWNYAFSKMVISSHGVASIVVKTEDYEGRKLNYEQIKSALSIMSGIKEIKAWALIIEWKDDYKVSLRSRRYDVSSVAQKYRGGGHRLASGAKMASLDELPKLLTDLDQLIIQTDKKNRHQSKE